MDYADLPGGDLIAAGLEDLRFGRRDTPEALLVATAATRLRAAGVEVPNGAERSTATWRSTARCSPSTATTRKADASRCSDGWTRSPGQRSMRPDADADRVRALARDLGRHATSRLRIYLTGGASAVLEGWRRSTMDVDVLLEPEDPGVLGRIPTAKEAVPVNVVFASPPDFIPEVPGWRERSVYVFTEGNADRARLPALFDQIESGLLRFPAIDPAAFRARVEAFALRGS